jgi:fatty acid synthase
MVDSAALNAFSAQVLGEDGVLANTAKSLLEQLGISLVPEIKTDDSENELQKLAETITSELGRNWVQLVEPKFDVKKIVLLDDRWASAKEDLARLFVNGSLEAKEANYHYVGLGQSIANAAGYWASRLADSSKVDLKEKFEQIASESLQDASSLEYANDIAIVTGATPDSIAGQVVQKLLSRGATVIMTASRINDDRLHWAKTLYREHANGQAKLWLVPANLSSYRDVDALIEWIGSVQRETIGGVSRVVKEQLIPTLLFPFAAPKVMGTMDDAGPTAENQTRLLLWSVEKLIAGLSKIAADTVVNHRVHTVLPGSPNRGVFGGDGAYGEVKAAFDAIVKRWEVEQTWASRVTLAHPKIGWVRGTGLMASNDPLVAAIEATGVKTYGTAEMADELLELCTPEQRKAAEVAPLNVDLTGGLGDSLDLAALQRQAAVDQTAATKEPSDTVDITFIDALPTPRANILPTADLDEWGEVSAQLEDMCVIVGVGEVGPWGSGRTRFEAEYGIQYDGSVELTPAGVLELAWMMNLLNWSDTPELGWYDQEGTLVDEAEIYEKYRDEVIARCGVRFFIDDGPIQDLASEQEVSVFLNRDITFTVSDKEIAKSYLAIDESHTKIHEDKETGEWSVTKLSGARVRVPRKATMTRKIGGQLPTNFNPAKWGIPQSMIESLDPLAIWNLVATVDAFLSSGFSPTEILQAVHPADVASTQGTGIGGTDSMRRLFVDGHLGEDRPSDILQETLPNVVAAHVMQSYVGGYGAMIHPVGACATAAVSVEEAVDKITCGKADFVVAGAIDDIGIESITGFGDMNATAKTQDLLDKGINPRFVSRANDRRRGGFVESEGGGTVLITRGDIALKLGLPVHGIVGYVRSFADGAHTSIPAPGLGALATARGGVQSKFVTNLAKLGVTPDDINVISKHDTSTNANDPNESELYTKLSAAIGRTTGNPLFVISQKTVVGHAKGGAAVFQVGGLCQLFQSGVIPANRSLDCVGEEFQAYDPIVWLREPLPLAKAQTIKAGLLTSLGFGHVSAMIAIVHPAAFERAVRDQRGMEALHAYLTQANQRLLFGEQKRNEGMLGKTPLFTPIHNRRFAEDAQVREVESEMLLDKAGRLNSDGTY